MRKTDNIASHLIVAEEINAVPDALYCSTSWLVFGALCNIYVSL